MTGVLKLVVLKATGDQLRDQMFHVAVNSRCILLYVSSATIIIVVSDHVPRELWKAVMYGQIVDWEYAVKL